MFLVNNVPVEANCSGCGEWFVIGPMADKAILAGTLGYCATARKKVSLMVSPDPHYRSVEQGGIL